MPRPDFDWMRREMLRNGVSRNIAYRTVTELGEHYQDLEAELLRAGVPPAEAIELAAARLGQPAVLIGHINRRSELKVWIYRYPRLAAVVLPLTWLLILPVAPVFAGVAHLSSVVRWSACLLLSAMVTAAMMLVMQLAISLS